MKKYVNPINGMLYWYEDGKIMYCKEGHEVVKQSMMRVREFNDYVEGGFFVLNEEPEVSAADAIRAAVAANPDVNPRWVAFDSATKTTKTGSAKNAEFMCWMADRLKDYASKYPEMLTFALGGNVVLDQAHLTNFIINGEWMQ